MILRNPTLKSILGLRQENLSGERVDIVLEHALSQECINEISNVIRGPSRNIVNISLIGHVENFNNFKFLSGLHDLKGLSINTFEEVDLDMLNMFSGLKRLKISILNEKTVSLDKCLNHLPKLTTLVLSNKSKNENFFDFITKIENLFLVRNDIKSSFLIENHNLKKISLSLLRIHDDVIDCPSNLNNVKYLFLDKISIERSYGIFRCLKNIEYLHLSRLSNVDIKNLQSLINLHRLVIDDSDVFNEEDIESLTILEELAWYGPKQPKIRFDLIVKLYKLKVLFIEKKLPKKIMSELESININFSDKISLYFRNLQYYEI